MATLFVRNFLQVVWAVRLESSTTRGQQEWGRRFVYFMNLTASASSWQRQQWGESISRKKAQRTAYYGGQSEHEEEGSDIVTSLEQNIWTPVLQLRAGEKEEKLKHTLKHMGVKEKTLWRLFWWANNYIPWLKPTQFFALILHDTGPLTSSNLLPGISSTLYL